MRRVAFWPLFLGSMQVVDAVRGMSCKDETGEEDPEKGRNVEADKRYLEMSQNLGRRVEEYVRVIEV